MSVCLCCHNSYFSITEYSSGKFTVISGGACGDGDDDNGIVAV